MKKRVPHYFKQFKCIASECEDTCCAGWEIVIDDDTYDIYNSVNGKFGERLKKDIFVDEDNEHIFRLKGNDCAFLNKNKMCDIYSELGEDALCYTCKQYPRFTEEFGSTREIGLSLSCPEAARLILNDSKKVEFEVTEDDEMVTAYNDISYEVFMQLMPARKTAIDLMQNRDIKLKDRIALLVKFGQDIQECIDNNKISHIEKIRKNYSQVEFLEENIKDFRNYIGNEKLKYDNMFKYFDTYIKLEHINEKCPRILKDTQKYFSGSDMEDNNYLENHKKFDEYYSDKMYEYEHLIVYFIFRYFMKSVYDYDLSAKIKLAVVSYLIIKELNVARWIENEYKFDKCDQVDIMHMYSKDIEHLEENIESLYEIFETNKIFDLKELIVMIMN